MNRSTRAAWRLTEAALLPPLMRQLKGEPLGPDDRPGQIAGLLQILRLDPAFVDLARALLDPDPTASRARFSAQWPEALKRLPTQGHHHLALLNIRWGWDALAQPGANPASLWERGLRHLSPVLADPAYLTEIALASGTPESADGLNLDLAEWIFEPHGQSLMDGVDDAGLGATEGLSHHWRVLAEGPALLCGHGDALLRQQVELICGQWRRQFVDRAMAVAAERARPVEPTSATPEELAAPFKILLDLKRVRGFDEHASIWALETAVAWSWPLFNIKDTARLQGLLDAARPFVQHVEALLLRGGGAFGRNSLCADYLLFAADFVPYEEQHAWFRRALEVCPGHRNSRLMLSYNLLNKARAELVKAESTSPLEELGILNAAQAIEAARRAQTLLDEVEEIFPQNERLPETRERLARVCEKLKVPPSQAPPAG